MSHKLLTLKSRQEFLALKRAKKYISKNFIAQYAPASNKEFQYGITASRKNGNAVKRNFIKRRLKEAITLAYNADPKEYCKINFITRHCLAACKFETLQKEVQQFFLKLK